MGIARQILQLPFQGMYKISTLGLTCRFNISRYTMYNEIQAVTKELNFGERVLSISLSDHLCRVLGFGEQQIYKANYPEYDVFDLSFEDEEFDCVVSDQVLEHIKGDPQRAIDETFRVIKRGGLAIHTTCLMMPVHGSPGDYWRFTTSGLEHLCRNASSIVAVDGWGNPFMPLISGVGLSFAPIPDNKWHPMNMLARMNRESYHHVVWVVAQK